MDTTQVGALALKWRTKVLYCEADIPLAKANGNWK